MIASKKPKLLKITKNASSVKIKWNKIPGEITGYKIEMSTSADFTKGVKRIIIKKSGVTNHKFGSLKKGKTYYFRIRAYKNTSEGVVYSKWSTIKKVTIK
ncbi:MAG: fibronectin type III domain-containing protein [Eubacterium sp.]|nr:fibronectin type III domain-containing protein [Eubacterium sp.]